MAFSGGLGDRNDERHFRSTQSPRDETFPSVTSPLRSIGNTMSVQTNSANDARAGLHRRFTTNNVPTLPTLSPLSPIGQQRRQAAEQLDYNTVTVHKMQLLEKKKLEYDYIREQKRRFKVEMELLDRQQRNQEDELVQLASDLSRTGISGRQSEPTTPPDFRDNGFPNAFSKPNRYSTGVISPPGLSVRPNRPGSQIMSPPHSQAQTASHIPSKSMPGSRRNSDEEDEDDYDYNLVTQLNTQSTRSMNRKSMPVTGFDRRLVNDDLPGVSTLLGHIDTTKYLFDDNEDRAPPQRSSVVSPESASFFHMHTADDKNNFPVLIRRGGDNTMQFSASSAALDLATTPSPAPEQQSNGWSSFASRHRQSQHSLPMNTLRNQADEYEIASPVDNLLETTPTKTMANNRRSMEAKFSPFGSSSKRSSLQGIPTNGTNGTNGMPKLQSSFSTNDIPTVKHPNGVNGVSGNVTPNAFNTHAEQHLHNHNASLGRIPPGVVNNRHSRELSGGDVRAEEHKSPYRGLNSALHASAAPFGPSLTAAVNQQAVAMNMNQNIMPQYSPAFYGGYGMNMIMNGQSMPQWGNGIPPTYQNAFQQYGPAYPQFPGGNRFPDSQTRVVQSRRTANGQDQARFQDFDLATMRKEILQLCKDQYGCRFLQKKLEERNEEFTQAIFEETKDAVIELMTDPFGNYLCQKLLEYTTDDQRTALIKNAAPQMVSIALNQHGTRALQKMIEYIVTPEQINTIIEALQANVVGLIQDLNGNHVIQKCLNHLKAVDAEFIFSAVGIHCVIVGTHRHGCCVLQRCIDHASGEQRNTLIDQITQSSYDLVQDPFGNYVVQYILDLNEPRFTQPLCLNYVGKVIELSKQKFSSNVIEKCIRVAPMEVKSLLIEELLIPGELESVMRDPFANYVVQTALDFADNDMGLRLIEAIRPVLPAVRQTPYGRRIQTKVSEREARLAQGNGPAMIDPASLATSPVSSPQQAAILPYVPDGRNSLSNFGAVGPNGYSGAIASPQPHRLSNPPLPAHLQTSVHQPSAFGRPPAGTQGFAYY